MWADIPWEIKARHPKALLQMKEASMHLLGLLLRMVSKGLVPSGVCFPMSYNWELWTLGFKLTVCWIVCGIPMK